ncbi:MAG: adenylate/guanylate cyclase domain-containing protein [Deltaproteobacteria bacterium]|nr:adenylate/guanylate cyclase domain-containing protein [Deltaproteobacteria bacterium]
MGHKFDNSHFVVGLIVFVDIRSFSGWCQKTADNVRVMTYLNDFHSFIETPYSAIGLQYVKYLGDGFMFIWENPDNKKVNDVVQISKKLVDTFGEHCEGKKSTDYYYETFVPTKIGISLAIGTIIKFNPESPLYVEYASHIINVASRLNKHAKPQGIIISKEIYNMLNEENKKTYKSDFKNLQGIAVDVEIFKYIPNENNICEKDEIKELIDKDTIYTLSKTFEAIKIPFYHIGGGSIDTITGLDFLLHMGFELGDHFTERSAFSLFNEMPLLNVVLYENAIEPIKVLFEEMVKFDLLSKNANGSYCTEDKGRKYLQSYFTEQNVII